MCNGKINVLPKKQQQQKKKNQKQQKNPHWVSNELHRSQKYCNKTTDTEVKPTHQIRRLPSAGWILNSMSLPWFQSRTKRSIFASKESTMPEGCHTTISIGMTNMAHIKPVSSVFFFFHHYGSVRYYSIQWHMCYIIRLHQMFYALFRMAEYHFGLTNNARNLAHVTGREGD